MEQIQADINTYVKKFPNKALPHIDADVIIDPIHNYANPSKRKAKKEERSFLQDTFDDLEQPAAKINALSGVAPNLRIETIIKVKREFQEPVIATLVGLIAHMAYWNVFGHFNAVQLDLYHMQQMFVSISNIKMNLDVRFHNSKMYHTFMMPMLMLCIRMIVELVFKNTYPKFYSVKVHEQLASKLVNDLIT